MDERSECQLFRQQKSALTEFALMLRYEIVQALKDTFATTFNSCKVKISIPSWGTILVVSQK